MTIQCVWKVPPPVNIKVKAQVIVVCTLDVMTY